MNRCQNGRPRAHAERRCTLPAHGGGPWPGGLGTAFAFGLLMEPSTDPPTRDDSPDPDQLVLLSSVRTEFEGQAMAAALRDRGVPVKVFAAAAAGVSWEGGYGNAVRVMVRRADAARAVALLKEVRQDSVDLDWDRVDVGEMEPGAPPASPFGRRRGGLSPTLQIIRAVGWGLLSATMLMWALGEQMAIPAAVIGAMLVADRVISARRQAAGRR
ncbi:MAG: hypothetical protein IT433_06525 [Phycisphaerales bacterium]|nr:hypothetical protein [Phycisphaerales bacterium]